MDAIRHFIDLFLHLDKHLAELVQNYGVWTYGILFLIIFAETGLVVTPFLPGDSLLFAAGAIAANPEMGLNVFYLGGLLLAAAIIGDTVNYHIGKFVGPRAMAKDRWFLKRSHLERTHRFFEKHGGKTIIIARFVPIVRTFAPFVAGIGAMSYGKFIAFNVIGAVAWVIGFMAAGYWFGNLEYVKRNFTLVILAIIVISILPGLIEVLRARRAKSEEISQRSDSQ